MLRRLRHYFETQSVLEVDTPALSRFAVSDVQIESLQVTSHLSGSPLYLQTSPEFFMKRLLAAGYPDIYSICRVFRDGEAGRRHQPEFTLAEWYRLGFQLDDIVDDTLHVIAAATARPDLAAAAVQLDYRDVFIDVAGIDPLEAPLTELAAAVGADAALLETVGDERDDWLDLILTSRIAPSFAADQLTVLRHYPASQAALARLCPHDDARADRFEVFMGTLELANGYVELTDASLQAARIAGDQADRQRRGREQRPHDKSLIAALESGLPACAGVAMGIERLQMSAEKTDDIRNVITFPFENSDE